MKSQEAFDKLWEFISESSADEPTESELKHALCLLGKANRIPEQLLSDWAAMQDELEAKFFLQMKYEDNGNDR